MLTCVWNCGNLGTVRSSTPGRTKQDYMTTPLTTLEREQLEMVLDKHSLADVLDALEIIANEKANHLTDNWQDEPLAKIWIKAAGWISQAGSRLRAEGL